MVGSKKIDQDIKKTFLNDLTDNPNDRRGVSRLVIRYENGTFYLAAFVFLYTKEEAKEDKLRRPEYYGLFDIESGRLIETRKCKDVEFSKASYDQRYSAVPTSDNKDAQEEYLEKAFDVLDSARQALQETHDPAFYMDYYNSYMKLLLNYVPSGFKRFYKDLSRPEAPAANEPNKASASGDTSEEEAFRKSLPQNAASTPVLPDPKNGREKKKRRDMPDVTKEMEDKKRRDAVARVFGPDAAAANTRINRTDDKSPAQKTETAKSEKSDVKKPASDNAGSEQNKPFIQVSRTIVPVFSEKTPSADSKEEKKKEVKPEEYAVEDDGIGETVALPPEMLQKLIEESKQKLRNKSEREPEKNAVDTSSAAEKEAPEKEAPGKEAPEKESETKALKEEKASGKSAPVRREKDDHEKSVSAAGSSAAVSHHADAVYTIDDVLWTPTEDLSVLPDRYFHIAERISEHIEFLPCAKKEIRFSYPLFCFRSDTQPGRDPWQMMQAKVLDPKAEIKSGRYQIRPDGSIYTSCRYKDHCIFLTCPYIIAAYIKYLSIKDPSELAAQRAKYAENKEEVDAEGKPGYRIVQPKIPYTEAAIRQAVAFIDKGLFGIVRKGGTADIFVVTYVSSGPLGHPAFNIDGRPDEIHAISSFSVSKDEIENGFPKNGYIKRLNGKKTPNGIDALIYADYLIKTGKLNALFPPADETDDDFVTIHF